MEIVITKINDVETVDSRIVANELGIEHRALLQLIKKHQKSIEENFNLVAFETLPRLEGKHGGGEVIISHLTEDQALFVGSLSRNTVKVIEFKARLVKAFSNARKLLSNNQQNSAIAQIEQHTHRPNQIQSAKDANKYAFTKQGGKEDAIEWNRKVAFHFTGKTPHELKEWAKKNNVPSKERTSGKEVIRKFRPEKAAGVSVADFFHSMGKPDEVALRVGEQAIPVVNMLMKYQNKQLK